jgi:hypothetical protein
MKPSQRTARSRGLVVAGVTVLALLAIAMAAP